MPVDDSDTVDEGLAEEVSLCVALLDPLPDSDDIGD